MKDELQGPLTLRGRVFSHEELLRVRAIVEASPDKHRYALSKMICEALDWRQANGRLKDRSCRDALLRLHERGFLQLPPRRRAPTHRRPITITDKTAPRMPPALVPRDISTASFDIITGQRRRADEALWNEYVERYHYLGYGVPVGPHIKYFVRHRDQIIACLAFAGAAWKVAPRDQWIGWSQETREANLHFVVNNTRFLIFPWIRLPNLASRLLSLATKRLPNDWHRLYAYRPLMLETFVNADLHKGICYRAANWVCVGRTQGRGKMDRKHQARIPQKLVFLHPLDRGAREMLGTS